MKMKRFLSILIAFVLAFSALNMTAFASEDILPSGSYGTIPNEEQYATVLPEPSTLDADTENSIKADYANYYDVLAEQVVVTYYGTLSDGSMLVNCTTEGNWSLPVMTFYVIGSYVYSVNDSASEIYLYRNNSFDSILDSYLDGTIDDALLDEIAIKLNLVKYPNSNDSSSNKQLSPKKQLQNLYYYAKTTNISGDIQPYSNYSFLKLYKAMNEAENVLSSSDATDVEYQLAYDFLLEALDMRISTSYAKKTYVLSLEENNDNGWYDEADWSDFATKRENLRVSFATNDEKTISQAYFDLVDSFISMTGKYGMAYDMNKDGVVDIQDVTCIQNIIAGYDTLNSAQTMLTRPNSSASSLRYRSISISCATTIQKALAGMTELETYDSDDWYEQFVYTNAFGDRFNLLICMVNCAPDVRDDEVNAKVKELESQGII